MLPAATFAADEPGVTDPQRREQGMNNLKQIMIAMQLYHDQEKKFPVAYIGTADKPLLSWRVALLPFLEHGGSELYAEFHLYEPWDSEHNKPLLARMPVVYRSPASKRTDGRTVYLAPRGKDTLFPGGSGVKIRQVTDGASNTIAIVEVDDAHAVPWTKPEDWTFNSSKPSQGLGNQFRGGVMVGFVDGSVHFLTDKVDADVWRKLFTINGHEPVKVPD